MAAWLAPKAMAAMAMLRESEESGEREERGWVREGKVMIMNEFLALD